MIAQTKAGISDSDFHGAVLAWKGAVALRQQQLRGLRREPGVAADAAKLQEVNLRLANLAAVIPDPKKASEHRRLLVDVTRQKEDLEVQLARKSAGFRQGQQASALTSDQLRATLPADTALIDFLEYLYSEPDATSKGKFRFEQRLLAFVVRHDRPIVRLDLGPTTGQWTPGARPPSPTRR